MRGSSMKIISGFRHLMTPTWGQMLENLKLSAERHGHDCLIYDLPTQDKWIAQHEELFLSLCWKWKVIFMRHALDYVEEDLLWIDADCLVQRKINFATALKGADIAFTLRDIDARHKTKEPVKDGYINSGVVFIRNNKASRWFLEQVQMQLCLSLYDQEAFNKVLLKYSDMTRHGEIIRCGRTRVKMLDCREYNNFYFDASSEQARILHFKSKGRGLYHNRVHEGRYHAH